MDAGKKRGHGVDETQEEFKKSIADRNWPPGICYKSDLSTKAAPPSSTAIRLEEESRGLALLKKLTRNNPKNPVMGEHWCGEELVRDMREYGIVSKSLITGTMAWVAPDAKLQESELDVETLAKETAWVIEKPSLATKTNIREVMDKVYKWTSDAVHDLDKWHGHRPYRERLRNCLYDYGRLTSAVIAMETLLYWGVFHPSNHKKSMEFTIDTEDKINLTRYQCHMLSWKLLVCGRYKSRGMGDEVSLTVTLILTLNLTIIVLL